MPIDMTDSPIPKGRTRKQLKGKRKRATLKTMRLVRLQVIVRANGMCERCGVFCAKTGEAHHKVKRSQGGKWTLENIEWLCKGCHMETHGLKVRR